MIFADLKDTAWRIYDNKEFEKMFVSLTGETKKKAYPALKTGRDHGKEEHILILPQLYKLSMSVRTDTMKRPTQHSKREEIMEKRIYPHTTAKF